MSAGTEELAGPNKPEDLHDLAFGFYEKFQPKIPKGKRGWDAKSAE
jgi:hypothetical protein